jgi:hypothetical protein
MTYWEDTIPTTNKPLVEEFIAGLALIPWFERLGKPSERDPEVFRIYDWAVWPGPEDSACSLQGLLYQKWHDELFQSKTPYSRLWVTIEAQVFQLIKHTVPYQADEDAWHGPNAAVAGARFLAALTGCTLLKYGSLGDLGSERKQWTLANEWSWYGAGHWPCGYFWTQHWTDLSHVARSGGSKRLIVY